MEEFIITEIVQSFFSGQRVQLTLIDDFAHFQIGDIKYILSIHELRKKLEKHKLKQRKYEQ